MKQCNLCKQEKPIQEFAPRKNKSLIPYCRECKKIYDREFYQKTIEKRRENKSVNSKNIRKRNATYIREYLEQNSCVDCGEKDPIVLEFDHRSDKKYDVSCMISGCHSIDLIREEISKCDVRCANCHRRKTAKQFNWHQNLI